MIQLIPLGLSAKPHLISSVRVTVREVLSLDSEKVTAVTTPRFVIGRAKDCDLLVSCPFASRHHCELRIDDDRVTVRDLDSKNGTVVNMSTVDGEQEIKAGDSLVVGLQVYEIQIDTHPEPRGCDPAILLDSNNRLGVASSFYGEWS